MELVATWEAPRLRSIQTRPVLEITVGTFDCAFIKKDRNCKHISHMNSPKFDLLIRIVLHLKLY